LTGTVHNETDKVLTAFVATGLDRDRRPIAAAWVGLFQGQGREGPATRGVPAGESRRFFADAFMDAQGRRFEECDQITGVEPTGATFK
jgi:hypothetical protein